MKYVGISLRFCVAEIMRGHIPVESVAYIVPGFPWGKDDKPHASYYSICWREWKPEDIDAVLSKIKIVPKQTEDSANISRGLWIPEDQFNWDTYLDADRRLRTEELTCWTTV